MYNNPTDISFFAPFTLPFIVGAVVMFAVVMAKYATWLMGISRAQLKQIIRGVFSIKTQKAVWEVIRESLLHIRIFRVNPLLGYMHASLAFGWFLLICTGWIETSYEMKGAFIPPQGHVFFKYFSSVEGLAHNAIFANIMDALLAVVLSGVALALFKRFRSRMMGMRRATEHILTDRIALSTLWFVFPLRLIAESLTCALYGGGGFLTGSLGEVLSKISSPALMMCGWWCYSIALGLFFVMLPFSRYMHIFTEVPLIFLRQYGITPSTKASSADRFEVDACSRCGICIDPCQLQSVLEIEDVQSAYFLRDRRYKMLELSVANNCLMCGRCESVCPVGINLNSLRLNSRSSMRNEPDEKRFEYLRNADRSSGEGEVGYFAGCMTMLTPATLSSMAKIFESAGESVWWADREGGVCCGRPLHLAGEVDSARKMMDYNRALFEKHNIKTLITSCPICLRVFREDYNLEGIEVIHHSEYIDRLLTSGVLKPTPSSTQYTYHDPCELGRGCGVYDAPRRVIESVGELREAAHNREESLCCGASLANTVINDAQQVKIATSLASELCATGAETIITSCPLCKKAIVRGTEVEVRDISEIVANKLP